MLSNDDHLAKRRRFAEAKSPNLPSKKLFHQGFILTGGERLVGAEHRAPGYHSPVPTLRAKGSKSSGKNLAQFPQMEGH